MVPEFPETVRGYVPTVTVDGVVIVSTVLPFGTNGLVSNVAFAPVGKPDTLRLTGDAKPFVPVSRVVYVTDCPWVILCEDGAVDIWKSGTGAAAIANVIVFV